MIGLSIAPMPYIAIKCWHYATDLYSIALPWRILSIRVAMGVPLAYTFMPASKKAEVTHVTKKKLQNVPISRHMAYSPIPAPCTGIKHDWMGKAKPLLSMP